MEPPTLWVDWIETSFRADAPRLRRRGGQKAWEVEGEPLVGERGKGPIHAARLLAAMTHGMQRFKRAREHGFSSASRLRDMDEEGIDTQILFPSVTLQLLGREFHDVELLAACCRAYNDWCQDYCSASPDRLRWVAVLPRQSVPLAIEEATRAAAAGAVGLCIRSNPIGGAELHQDGYEPLWSQIERLDLPLCIHDSNDSPLASQGQRFASYATSRIVSPPLDAMTAVVSLLWYGVLERHPMLHVVFAGTDSGWVPYWLQRMEQQWRFSGNAEHPDLQRQPTDYFLRQIFVTGHGDEGMLRATLDLIGDENILFQTDYPRAEGSWPWGLIHFDEQDIPEPSRCRILWDNGARVFHLEQ